MAKVSTSYYGETIGLMGIDPGRTTGLCYGTFDLKGSTADVFARSEWFCEEWECSFDDPVESRWELSNAIAVAEILADLDFEWNLAGIPVENRIVAFEDFVLRGTSHGTTNRSGIAPARFMSCLWGLLVKKNFHWIPQTPSDAKSRWTSDRLRRSGLWTPRLAHGRDGTRHAALFVSKHTH